MASDNNMDDLYLLENKYESDQENVDPNQIGDVGANLNVHDKQSKLIEIASAIMDIKSNLKANVYTHSKRTKRARSAVWSQFHEIRVVESNELIENFYLCLNCESIVHSPGSDGNTNVFHRHACTESDEEMCVKKKRKKNNKKNIIVKDDDKTALKLAAAKYVALDLQPYKSVGDPGTIALCAAAMKFGQRYQTATEHDLRMAMPSRNTTQAIIAEIADSTREKIKTILAKAREHGGFGATTDSWTDSYKHNTYMCVAVHVKIPTEMKIKRYDFVIHTDTITDYVKSKEVVVRRLIDVFAEFGLDVNDVKSLVTFVTDRGSNFRYGLIGAGFERLSCYDHLIHNLMSAMIRQEIMHEMISNASKLTSFIKNSGLNPKLKSSLKLYTVTRWNSILIMLQAILLNFDDIIQVLNEKQRATKKTNLLDFITCINRDVLGAVCEFLKPFKEMSDQLEGNYDTLHIVWPVYLNIQGLLAENFEYDVSPGFDLIEEMKTIGRQYVLENLSDFKPSLRHKMAVVLHPLMKQLPIINQNERDLVYEQIKEIIDDRELISVTVTRIETQPVPSTSTNSKIPQFMQNFFSSNEPATAEKSSELKKYLDLAVEMPSVKFNADEWWWEHKNEFPQLFKLFLKVSSIPATSASSERDFSIAGLIVDNRRSLILPKNVQNIIIARNRLEK